MSTDADVAVSSILHADDDFLIELGRLTLLFARIEEALAGAAVELGEISSNDDPPPRSGRPEVMQLRLLDKRNLLKTVVVEMSRFYDVDSTRVPQLLDQLGGLNRFRRIIVHGFIRWSASERRPVFVDSRGSATSAWPWDVLSTNQKALQWYLDFCEALSAFLSAVLRACGSFAERLLTHPRLDSRTREWLTALKSQVADDLGGLDAKTEAL